MTSNRLTLTTKNYIEDEDGIDNTGKSGTIGSTSYTDHDDSLVNNGLKFSIPVSGGMGSYTYSMPSSVTVNGHTFSIINNGNGTFSLNTSQFQYLNNGQAVQLVIPITVNDGCSSVCGNFKVTIVGSNDNTAPCAQDVCYQDDEDGVSTVTPNDTIINTRLVFGFNASDANGDALTYTIKTGTFTNGGQTYTVAATSTAGTYTVTNAGQTFTIKNLGNGRFEYLTSEFQYLNQGQNRSLVFQYTASDGSSTSNTATAKVTIYGTNDNHNPCVVNVSYKDDEDASASVSPNDTQITGRLVFGFGGTDVDGDNIDHQIQTGTYTINGQTYTVAATSTVDVYKITNNGQTFTVKDIGSDRFELLTSEFQYLNQGQTRVIAFKYIADDRHGGVSGSATATVTIYGTNDNHAPCAANVCYQDDEDGLSTVNPNDTLINTRLVFAFSGSDSDGDALSYTIKTGTFTSGGQSYTIASTSTAGTYTVTNAGQTFTIKNLGNGRFEYLTSEFQYLNSGQTRTLVFQYTANDGSSTSNTATATVTIYGTSDNRPPVANWVHYYDDEDGDETFSPNDTEVANKLIFSFVGTDPDGDALTYQIKTGTYTHPDAVGNVVVTATGVAGEYTVTTGGHTYHVKNLGNGKFEYQTSEFQYLNPGQSVFIPLQYTATDSHGAVSAYNWAKVTIYGRDDNHTPCTVNVAYSDDEDGLNTVNPSDTEINTRLVFSMHGTDSDGDTLTYTIKTGTFTSGGQTYTVAATSTAGTYTVTNNGQTFTVKDLGGGKFEYLTSEFQYLNSGQTRTLVFQYTANDGSSTSNTATATVTIYGTDDNKLIASNQTFVEDEDATNNTGATATISGTSYTDLDQNDGTANNGPLTFTINNFTHVGSGAVTFSGIPATVVGSDGVTYNITNNGNGTFTLNKAQFQALSVGEGVTLQFSYTVSADGLTSTAIAKVVIIGTNDGPDAVDDNLGTINAGSSTSFNILANDTDPDGDDLDVSSINSVVINGVTIPQAQWSQYFTVNNANGQLVFNSANMNVAPGTSQNVVINYSITDHNGGSDSANIFVTVKGSDLSLIASNQQFVEDEDATNNTGATATLSGTTYTDLDQNNGTANNGPLTFTINNYTYNGSGAVTISGVPATVVGSDGNTYSITNNGNGTFTLNKAQYQALSVGEAVKLTFTYTATAGSLSSSATATVVIIGTNDGPDAVDDNLGTITTGASTAPFNILANDTDPDGDDLDVSSINSLTINGVTIPQAQWSQYITVNNANGQFVFNSANMNVPAGTSQNVVINYSITDHNGGSDSANIFVTVNGPNLSLVASNQQFVDDEDAIDGTGATAGIYTDLDNGIPGTLQFTINNYTYNGSAPVTFSGVPATVVGSDGHTYNIVNNGNGTFTVNKADFQYLAPGQFVTLTFNYTVTAGALSSTAQAKVVIIGTNDGIDAVDDNVGTINQGASATVMVLANDTDTDNEDLDVSSINSLNINGTNIPSSQWAQYFTVNNETGQLVFNSANMNVPAGTSQNVVINYTATDPHGATDSANVYITVKGPDIFIDATDQQFVDDEDAIDNTGAIAGAYTDEDDGIPGSLEFQIATPNYNSTGTIVYSGIPASVTGSDGQTYTITNLGNGKFSVSKAAFQHLAVGEFVTLAFNYTVTASGLSDTAQAQVVIIGTNDGPDAVDDQVGVKTEGSIFDVDVLVNDTDPDGDPIHVTTINSITIDGTVITNPAQIATYVTILPSGEVRVNTSSLDLDHDYNIVINYTIADPYGLTDSANVFINVQNPTKVIYYGDSENYTLNLTTLPANATDEVKVTSGTISDTTKTFQSNSQNLLDADAYGDVKNFTLSVTAGDATAYASPAVLGGSEYALAITDAVIQNNTFNFGNDVITVSRGLIVGDAANVLLVADQGNATANYDPNCFDPFAKATANVDIRENIFNFGDDTLTIGKGDVFGDVNNITLTYINGTASGNGITQDDDNWNAGNVFNFGDDTITAREGTLTGDLGSITANGTTYNTVSGIQGYIASAANTNTFNFGHDTFVTTLAQPFNIKITDFGIGGVHDTIKITGASNYNGVGGIDVNDLISVSQVVNESGHIKLVIDTNNDGTAEGTIEFNNISYGAGTEITDYITSTDIIFSA